MPTSFRVSEGYKLPSLDPPLPTPPFPPPVLKTTWTFAVYMKPPLGINQVFNKGTFLEEKLETLAEAVDKVIAYQAYTGMNYADLYVLQRGENENCPGGWSHKAWLYSSADRAPRDVSGMV